MTDPHQGMVSFQQCMDSNLLDLAPVTNHKNIFSHLDFPTPGVPRLTYVQLSTDRKTIEAFISCVMNGEVDGCPCVAVGYAVPESARNQGLAKGIFRDAINDQINQARRNGIQTLYVEAVIDINNLPSQRVAEAVLNVERENIIDSISGNPAYRYTARITSSL